MSLNISLSDSRTWEKTSLSWAIQTSQPLSGWLWSITDFPQVWNDELQSFAWSSYQELAFNILSRFDFWVTPQELKKIIDEAYWDQWHKEEITPVKQIWNTNLHSLHLWYWPTFAFKNVALEFLPRLLSVLAKWKIINVLWASSWDTINAAHSWVKWTNIRSIFMLPNEWPSKVQRLQAVNGIVNNPNALTLLADVPFDPLQDIVKKVNSPEFSEFKAEHNITSFNSINIARILAQVVYYFRAYTELLKNWNIRNWDEVVYSVPSWNFWDALAGYYAKKMWLPIKKIVVATNENDMLHKFFQTWIYEPPKKDGKDYVKVTNAPSMDIAKSSNFERMLFDICDFDNKRIKHFYDTLNVTWKFQVNEETLSKIQKIFTSSTSTDKERLNVISDFWTRFNHWIDTHTAAAVVPWVKDEPEELYFARKDNTPVIFLETSHIAQFTEELQSQWIVVPWMNEFDETINAMRKSNPSEWVNYLHVSWKFDDTFKQIQRAIAEIMPSKF